VFGNNERKKKGRKKEDDKERNIVVETKEWRKERKIREREY